MTDRSVRVTRARFALEILLALCAMWLVVQNLALLLAGAWPGAPAAVAVASALFRAVTALLERVWPLLAVLTFGLGLAAGLVARGLEAGKGGTHGR